MAAECFFVVLVASLGLASVPFSLGLVVLLVVVVVVELIFGGFELGAASECFVTSARVAFVARLKLGLGVESIERPFVSHNLQTRNTNKISRTLLNVLRLSGQRLLGRLTLASRGIMPAESGVLHLLERFVI